MMNRPIQLKASEHITVNLGERKKELMQLSHKTGIQVASLVRSWIYAKLDEENQQRQAA